MPFPPELLPQSTTLLKKYGPLEATLKQVWIPVENFKAAENKWNNNKLLLSYVKGQEVWVKETTFFSAVITTNQFPGSTQWRTIITLCRNGCPGPQPIMTLIPNEIYIPYWRLFLHLTTMRQEVLEILEDTRSTSAADLYLPLMAQSYPEITNSLKIKMLC